MAPKYRSYPRRERIPVTFSLPRTQLEQLDLLKNRVDVYGYVLNRSQVVQRALTFELARAKEEQEKQGQIVPTQP